MMIESAQHSITQNVCLCTFFLLSGEHRTWKNFTQYSNAILEGNNLAVLENTPLYTIPEGSTHGQMCLVQCVGIQDCHAALLTTRESTQTCVLLSTVGGTATETPYLPDSSTWNEPWQTLWNQLSGPPNSTLLFVAGK